MQAISVLIGPELFTSKDSNLGGSNRPISPDQIRQLTKQLITFVDRNRLLINIILKSNIILLESSFAPLMHIPRCRHLLHFDIKRSYFRLKIKKLKQLAQRASAG